MAPHTLDRLAEVHRLQRRGAQKPFVIHLLCVSVSAPVCVGLCARSPVPVCLYVCPCPRVSQEQHLRNVYTLMFARVAISIQTSWHAEPCHTRVNAMSAETCGCQIPSVQQFFSDDVVLGVMRGRRSSYVSCWWSGVGCCGAARGRDP